MRIATHIPTGVHIPAGVFVSASECVAGSMPEADEATMPGAAGSSCDWGTIFAVLDLIDARCGSDGGWASVECAEDGANVSVRCYKP